MTCTDCERKDARIERMVWGYIRLLNEGTLSEGQVIKLTGLDRIEIRGRADFRAALEEQ